MSAPALDRAAILCALLALAGCGMTNEEIIAEVKKCHAAGMKAKSFVDGLSMRTMHIECQP